MYLNAGVSSSSKGFDQSTYTIYSFDTDGYSSGSSNLLNKPEPTIIFKDQTNTNANGNVYGMIGTSNDSGQLPAWCDNMPRFSRGNCNSK
jgi:hypothetical protein